MVIVTVVSRLPHDKSCRLAQSHGVDTWEMGLSLHLLVWLPQ